MRYPILHPLLIIGLFIFIACTPGETDSSSESSDTEERYTVVEELPQYEGGMDAFYSFIQNAIRYPAEAREAGIEGIVEVGFSIERDGTVSQVHAINGIGRGCDAEAVRVVKAIQAFTPGSQRGRSVRVQMLLPIEFKLDRERLNDDGTPMGIIIVNKAHMNGGQLKVSTGYTEGILSGTVYDPEGNVLAGANLVRMGTTSGTVSDRDGTFSLPVASGDSVMVSFVGYEGMIIHP